MLAIVLAGAYRDKFGGDHIDDVRAALAAYEERIGWKRRRLGDAGALVFIGFMGAGKTIGGARRRRPRSACGAVDSDHELEAAPRQLDRGLLRRATASARSARRRRTWSCELLERAAGAGALARRRRDRLARACASCSPRHTVVLLDVDAETAWRRCRRPRRPLARDRERFAALHAERAPLYESLADAVLLDTARARPCAARPPRCGARARARRARSCCGRPPRPATTRCYVGEGAARRRLLAARAAGASSSPTSTSARSTRARSATSRPTCAIAAGRGGQDARRRPRRVLRALADGRDGPRRPRRRARRRRRRRPRRASAPRVYQRGVPVVQVPTTLVAQVDSAYGGKTGVDLPEGKNYAGAYHQPAAVLADPRALATLPPEELAAGWAEVVKTALIAGGPLWARVRSRPSAGADRDLVLACARTKLGVVAARRARRRPPPGPQPRPHGRARDRDRDRLRALPPRRGGRARPARRAARSPAGRSCAPRSPSCSAARGLPTRLDAGGRRARRCSPPSGATRSAAAGASGSCWSRRPGDVRTGAAGGAGRCSRAAAGRVGRAMRNRVAVLHGVNLDVARPPSRASTTAGSRLTAARAPDRAASPASWGSRRSFFQTNHEGEFVEELHRAPRLRRRPDPQPGRLDALRLGAARRARDRRAARGRGAPLRRQARARRSARISVISEDVCVAHGRRARARTATATALERLKEAHVSRADRVSGAAGASASSTCCSSPTSSTSAT